MRVWTDRRVQTCPTCMKPYHTMVEGWAKPVSRNDGTEFGIILGPNFSVRRYLEGGPQDEWWDAIRKRASSIDEDTQIRVFENTFESLRRAP